MKGCEKTFYANHNEESKSETDKLYSGEKYLDKLTESKDIGHNNDQGINSERRYNNCKCVGT